VAEHHVTGRDRERGRTARETTDDGSRHSALSAGAFRVLLAALIAALLLVATEFSTVASVDVGSTSCEVIQDSDPDLADRCSLSGFERNGGSFLLVGPASAAPVPPPSPSWRSAPACSPGRCWSTCR
jgi:hypothetical protein